jgi:hypothetical protein
MKSAQVAAVVASLASSALAQFPACANNCVQQALSGFNGNFNQLCQNTATLTSLNSCLSNAGCNANDRNTINNYIATTCNNAVSSSFFPSQTFNSFNTFSTPYPTTGFGGGYNTAALSAYNSYTSAHPSGWTGPDYSSFTSQYGPVPTGSYTSAGGSFGSGPGFGGFGGPFGMGPGGWSAAQGGPFGNNNWGQGPYGSMGPWTTGAWTSWWGTDKCPPSTWSGWTSGSWSSAAAWTTWTGCTARTTAASVYTTYSNGVPTVATSFGYQVAQAQQTGSSTVGNAAPAGKTVASGAAALAFLAAVLVA